MRSQNLYVFIAAVVLAVAFSARGGHAYHLDASVLMNNVSVIRWALSFGFSKAGTIAFNATPDQDTNNYRSNFSILICNEEESDAIIHASAKALCHLSCASRCLLCPFFFFFFLFGYCFHPQCLPLCFCVSSVCVCSQMCTIQCRRTLSCIGTVLLADTTTCSC